MKKIIYMTVLSILVVLAGGYFYLKNNGVELYWSEADIREKMATRLPMTKTYYSTVDVTLDNPRVTLHAGQNRLHFGLDVQVNILGSVVGKVFSGGVDVSSEINYQPEDAAFYLINPKVESIDIPNIPTLQLALVQRALSLALTEFYKTRPLYTLKSSDTPQAALKMVLKRVSVEEKGVTVSIGVP